MEQHEMIALVERHLKAEGAGDVDGAVGVYTDDIVHDEVGFPGTPRTGKDAARDFYKFLTANFRTEEEVPLNRFFDANTMILEQSMTGTVIGEFLGITGNGRRVTFRILHVFGFRDGLISREQVWIDSGAIVAQLTSR
ncbi:MAG TPA: nuclear transport factor 2 family protein [Acidimicrobiales bacterium]|nr:nuclear transport factor 2 family protein [Acidimicrobiales bacterium]